MKVLVQRVARARVSVEGRTTGEIGRGLLIYLGCEPGDDTERTRRLALRASKLRVFADADGKSNLAVTEVGGAVLLVSQFTLAADLRKGNRPSFTTALAPEPARLLVEEFGRALETLGLRVARGEFGAEMLVESVNEGPATYWLADPDRA